MSLMKWMKKKLTNRANSDSNMTGKTDNKSEVRIAMSEDQISITLHNKSSPSPKVVNLDNQSMFSDESETKPPTITATEADINESLAEQEGDEQVSFLRINIVGSEPIVDEGGKAVEPLVEQGQKDAHLPKKETKEDKDKEKNKAIPFFGSDNRKRFSARFSKLMIAVPKKGNEDQTTDKGNELFEIKPPNLEKMSEKSKKKEKWEKNEKKEAENLANKSGSKNIGEGKEPVEIKQQNLEKISDKSQKKEKNEKKEAGNLENKSSSKNIAPGEMFRSKKFDDFVNSKVENQHVETVPGIGKKLTKNFERNGVETVENLCSIFKDKCDKDWRAFACYIVDQFEIPRSAACECAMAICEKCATSTGV